MREAEGKRRTSRSEAIAVISLIIFIIVFQLVTFLIGRFAPMQEEEVFSYPSLPDKDSSFSNGVATITTYDTDSCASVRNNGSNNDRNRTGTRAFVGNNDAKDGADYDANYVTNNDANRKKQGLSGSRIIKVRQNSTPYGKRQYEYKRAEIIDLNSADSASLVTLYGIGPYFAKRILEYRERLGGSYVSIFQLLEIKGIDSSKFSSIRKRIKTGGSVCKFSIAESDFNFLRRNPYIGYASAKRIIAFREEHGARMCRLDILLSEGILNQEQVDLLKAYVTE